MARPERFELPTYCSGGNRSIQLSYGRAPLIIPRPLVSPAFCGDLPTDAQHIGSKSGFGSSDYKGIGIVEQLVRLIEAIRPN